MKKKNIIIIIILLIIAIIAYLVYSEFNMNNAIDKNHKLLFEIFSDGGRECGYVTLKIFDDKTYEFYDKFIESEPSSIGKYHYDANKVLKSIINQEPTNNNNKYIVAIGDNRYYVDNNKEIKKLIHSIFLYPLRVNLNKCPS